MKVNRVIIILVGVIALIVGIFLLVTMSRNFNYHDRDIPLLAYPNTQYATKIVRSLH